MAFMATVEARSHPVLGDPCTNTGSAHLPVGMSPDRLGLERGGEGRRRGRARDEEERREGKEGGERRRGKEER